MLKYILCLTTNNMSFIAKQLLINRLHLPAEIIDIVKDFTFHKIKKIPENDPRYQILLKMPLKDYDDSDDTTFVYLSINTEKDYFLVYKNLEIFIQTFRYGVGDDNTVYFVDGSIFAIE